MKKRMKLILLVISFSLSACDTMMKKQEVILITPPDNLLVECESVSPPDKIEYMTSNLKKREEYLTDYAIKQNGVINKCNNTIVELREWKIKQKEVYGKHE